ncbi:zinc finger protein [Carpediemonas membranifera]|uniref:RING-type E3 ubiquitin transferase n=1 Tax=Carpediemonas membranifera TaxID=201153 RepID=A0A8J6E894_9EUKA|nr:zinc finger protein [Carpediemonas membranifera]|eukprot:KAG9391585.1 zinc finger protein [Carpediemonas membranifera]
MTTTAAYGRLFRLPSLAIMLLFCVFSVFAAENVTYPTEWKTNIFEGKWNKDNGRSGALSFSEHSGLFQVFLTEPTGNDTLQEFTGAIYVKDGVYLNDAQEVIDVIGEYYPEVGRIYMKGILRLSFPYVLFDSRSPSFGDNNRTGYDEPTFPWPPVTIANVTESAHLSEATFELFVNVDPIDEDSPIDWVDSMNGTFVSTDGGVFLDNYFRVDVHLDMYERALLYSFVQIVVLLVLMAVTYKQHVRAWNTAVGQRMSPLALVIFAVQDCIVFLSNAFFALIYTPVLNAFALAALLAFAQWIIIENQFVMSVWKSRRSSQPQQALRNARDAIGAIYFRMYAIIIVCIVMFLWMQYLIVLPAMFLLYIGWIPQIWHQARKNCRRAFPIYYIVLSSACRSFYLLYFFASPWNFLTFEPSYICTPIIIGIGIVTTTIVCLQQRWPRFFIPNIWRPKAYRYNRAIPDEVANSEDGLVCVICMQPVDSSHSSQYMIAPCNHVFHKRCLEQWLDIKMECPSCRAPLPTP